MKIWLLIALCAFFLSGCIQPPTNNPTCNSPYIKVGNDCCLDSNKNSICDKDEPQPCPPQTQTIEDRIKACGSDESCRTNIALETNNPNLCLALSSDDQCIGQLAARYNNPSYCNLLGYDFQKSDCLSNLVPTNTTCPSVTCPTCPAVNATVPGNLSLTDRLERCKTRGTTDDQTNCMTALALETDTPSICHTLMYDFESGYADHGNCFIMLAIKYKNKGYCDLAPYPDMDSCNLKVDDAIGKK